VTDNSNSIYQEMNRNASRIKKRTSFTSWMETDLDLIDNSRVSMSESATPLFIETAMNVNESFELANKNNQSDISKMMNSQISSEYSEENIDPMALDSDDLLEEGAFGNLSQQEKQEIKTVRIVKRESQQRQRDRERTGYLSQKDQVMEAEAQSFNNAINGNYGDYQRSQPLTTAHEIFNPSGAAQMPTNYSNDYYNSINIQSNNYPVSIIDRTADLYSESSDQQYHYAKKNYLNYYPPKGSQPVGQKAESIQSLTKIVSELSPVFQSEAARQIIIEISSGNPGESDSKVPNASKQRRAVPKEKRRHFTAPHHVNAKTVQTIQQSEQNNSNKNVKSRRGDLCRCH
jgi:hypothetical protein